MKRRQFMACTGAAFAAPVFAHDKEFNVEIRGFDFELPQEEVHPTDRITFTNHDLTPHTATANDGSWDTGILEKGDSITLTVDETWTGDFYCVLHPAMTGTLAIGKL